MQAHILKWGNSQGVRLSKKLLHTSRLDVGDAIEITAEEGKVIIKGIQKDIRSKYRLEDLVARIPDNHEPSEVNWGPPVGKEAW